MVHHPPDVKPQVESFEHLNANSPLSAVHLLRSYASPDKGNALGLDEKFIQNHLASLLQIANRLPRRAMSLLSMILTRFASPAPQLANSVVDILCNSGGHSYALQLLDGQLSNPSLPLAFQAYFHHKKTGISYNHTAWEYCKPALESAIPVLIDQYGDHDSKTLSAKYKLLILYIRVKDFQRAIDLYGDVRRLRGEKDAILGTGIERVGRLVERWYDELMKAHESSSRARRGGAVSSFLLARLPSEA